LDPTALLPKLKVDRSKYFLMDFARKKWKPSPKTQANMKMMRRTNSAKEAPKAQRVAVGEYDLNGYEVLVLEGGRTVQNYSAGNHRQDSTQPAPIGSPEALTLAEIRKMCQKTTKDMAAEHKAKYGGVTKREAEAADRQHGP
jgi:hypothetical protein